MFFSDFVLMFPYLFHDFPAITAESCVSALYSNVLSTSLHGGEIDF